MPSVIRFVAAGLEEGAGSQDQSQYTDKSDVAGPADGLCESSKAEAGGKQIEQSDQCSDPEEVYNSNLKIRLVMAEYSQEQMAFTAEEKYRVMAETNPAMALLKERLDLQID